MKKILSAIAFLAFFIPGWAQPSDSYIMSILDTAKAPGISVVVIKDGHWIYERNLGIADVPHHKSVTRKTIYGASTVSCAVVATAVMQLKERGLLSLNNSINHYLPFVFVDPNRPSDSVTMRMLLTESGSIKDYVVPPFISGDSPVSLDSFIRNYFLPGGIYYNVGNFIIDLPGTNWEHSEASFALAAYIVERITGDKFSHYCDTAIFNKLCMKNTSYLLSEVADTTTIARPYIWHLGAYEDRELSGMPHYPAQQLRTNISSLARFTTMLMQYGIFEGTRILDSSSVAAMVHSYLAPSYYGLGLGFYLTTADNMDSWWFQSGYTNGTAGAIYMSYTRKIGIALLCNGYGGSNNLKPLLDTLYSYALTVTPTATDTFPDCNDVTGTENIADIDLPVSIFPNPTSSEATIATPEAGVAVLTDMQGQKKQTYLLKKGNNIVSMQNTLPPGMYLIAINNEEGVLLGVKKLLYLP